MESGKKMHLTPFFMHIYVTLLGILIFNNSHIRKECSRVDSQLALNIQKYRVSGNYLYNFRTLYLKKLMRYLYAVCCIQWRNFLIFFFYRLANNNRRCGRHNKKRSVLPVLYILAFAYGDQRTLM